METVPERLTEYSEIAPAEDASYAYTYHEGNSLWRGGLAMVARAKHNRRPPVTLSVSVPAPLARNNTTVPSQESAIRPDHDTL